MTRDFTTAIEESMWHPVDFVAIARQEGDDLQWGHVRLARAWHALRPARPPWLSAERMELTVDQPEPSLLPWGEGSYPAEMPTYYLDLLLRAALVRFIVTGPIEIEFGASLSLHTVRTKVIYAA